VNAARKLVVAWMTFLVARGALVATVCETVAGQGRVRCNADIRSVDDAVVVAWADLQVVALPGFLRPLKARLGGYDAPIKTERLWNIGFAFIANERGDGDALVRVRAILCQEGRCQPVQIMTPVHVHAG
jgi:hypothetical protein